MRDAVDKVLAFHRKHNQAVGLHFDEPTCKDLNTHAEAELGSLDEIRDGLAAVVDLAELLERYHEITGDKRFLRMHLLLEEASELCLAMLSGNVIETADGIADLLYVTVGAGITLNLPVAATFDEVHASNMTKERCRADDDTRFRGKGAGFKAPDLAPIIAEFRKSGGYSGNG